eukprot:scaffold15140_cov63-Cyclotella_meneghiniana.AAC.8
MATFNEIRYLCENKDRLLPESELVRRLKHSLICPNVLSTKVEDGWTLLHIAAAYGRSREFCRLLIDLNPSLVKARNNDGWLPLHMACYECNFNWENANENGNVDTIMYLLEIYPESIDIATATKEYPLNLLVDCIGMNEDNENEAVVLVQFLLKHNGGAASAPDEDGKLPLHYACSSGHLAFIKPLFDVHPDAIFLQNNDGYTPLDLAGSKHRADSVQYLETQLDFQYQALDDQELENNGQLPIHRVLQDRVASVGAIKLMIAAYPASIHVADEQGCTPLHLACRYGNLGIVKTLADEDENCLATLDIRGNLPLHHACLGGKLDIVNYISGRCPDGVSLQNTKRKLPIELLIFDAECDQSSIEFMDTVEGLFKTNPAITLANLSPGLFA